MVSFRDLTGGQLEKMLANTELEISAVKILISNNEIRSVLKKYKISIEDIDLQSFDKKTSSKAVSKGKAQAKAHDNHRISSKSKYANPNGVETWEWARPCTSLGSGTMSERKLILPPLKRTPDL